MKTFWNKKKIVAACCLLLAACCLLLAWHLIDSKSSINISPTQAKIIDEPGLLEKGQGYHAR